MPFTEPASSLSGRVDTVFLVIFIACAIALLGITGAIVGFVFRYRRARHPQPVNIEGHAGLEIVWTLVTTVIFVAMFVFGWTNFKYMREAPRDAMEIDVTARQWSWSFKYPNGKVTRDLYLALDRPVKLLLHSADVVHGFYVPAFRVKSDVVPGKTNFVWFAPTLLGSFDVECTVICGLEHSRMLARVDVVPEAAFKEWYFGPADAPPPKAGEVAAATPAAAPAQQPAVMAVLESQSCLACHSLDGSPGVGPTFKARFGTRDVVLVDDKEREVTLDEAYYRRAIQEPQAEVVKGYPAGMPEAPLAEADLAAVIAYLKALK